MTHVEPTSGDAEYRAVCEFLYEEAALLDSFRLSEWLELVTDDIVLEVPIRVERDAGSDKPEFSHENYFLRNEYDTLHERVMRLDKEYAWAENPRSRVNHNITNVRVTDRSADEIEVRNNQLVFRSRGGHDDYDLLSAKRVTQLRETDDGYRIAHRTVYLDHTLLPTKNITLALL